MATTRIVQITDLHILQDQDEEICGVNPSQSLAKVIESINGLKPQVDFVIASGDLTDDGSELAYQHLRNLFEGLDCPVYIMAGNHDEIDVMNSVLSGNQILSTRQASCQNWRLLFVNSKLEGGSQGYISNEELDWLEAQLQQSDNQPVMLAMHHSPLRLCASATCQFENADKLLSLLQDHTNAKVLIAGHTHIQAEETHNHLRILTTPSTMVQVTHNQLKGRKKDDQFWDFHQPDGSRHGYRIVDLLENNQITSEVRWVSAS